MIAPLNSSLLSTLCLIKHKEHGGRLRFAAKDVGGIVEGK
jgi:hypothetical protein